MRHFHCCGPVSRRGALEVGALALGGLTLRDVLAARESNGQGSSNTAVIMLYQHGGASQLETYDLKPDAPVEYRSIYQPIATNVPGVEISERFPLQAQLADKFSLVRSLNHDVGIHSDGGIIVLTGKRPTVLDPTSQSKSEHPDFGSIASKVRGPGPDALPAYVAIPQRPYMTRPTYLGLHHSAFEPGDPGDANYRPLQVSVDSRGNASPLYERRQLVDQLDRVRTDLDPSGQFNSADEFRNRAFDVLASSSVAEAFQVDREATELRQRYGLNRWGQSCLLARRLAEAGAAVVNVYFDTPKSGEEFTNWDDHIQNAGRPGHFGKYLDVRLPYMDQALSALIDDVWRRGLQQRILIVVVGEFGRTPRLSHNANGTGRDHWPQAYTALVSGGGLKMGQVVGATNSKSEFPTRSPYTPQDLLATIYRHLGIDTSRTFTDFSGRPVSILSDAQPIRELI
jgi:hypothetical protein